MKRDTLQIVKIGGKIIEEEDQLNRVLKGFVAMNGLKILVHGGGKRTSEVSRQLGIEPRMHYGRRITDAATLEVATMVYAGLGNKTIVARLQALQCDALGLSGADGNVIQAHKRPVRQVDYGFAGDIDRVNTDLIRHLLLAQITPVFCAITHDGRGQLLNTNADTIAARLAIALARHYEVSLHYCFEKPGVLRNPDDEGSVLRSLDQEEYSAFKHQGIITDGMIPKLDNAFQALYAGVQGVVICGPASLPDGVGTHLQLAESQL